MLWGTTGTAQAFAPPGATPLAIGAVRLAIGGVALLTLAAIRGVRFTGKSIPLGHTVLAGACIATYQVSFFGAVARTGVAVGTIVAIGSAPVLAGLIGVLFRNERPGTRWIIATTMAVVGCGLLILSGAQSGISTADTSAREDRLGISLALLAGASYAIYSLASKRLVEVLSPDEAMALVFCLGAVLLSPLFFIEDLAWLADPRGGLVALHLGLLATATAYALFARGLKTIPVPTAVSLSLAEPLTAGLLGLALLGEKLSFEGVIGIALVFSGLVWLALPGRKAIVKSSY